MGLRTIGMAVALLAALQGGLAAAEPAATGDPEVKKGIALVEDADYDAAIFTLDAAARRLAAEPRKARDLSQAYLYLGIAYMGKGHEAAARAKFREALAQSQSLTLNPDKFPPKVIDMFEAAREDAGRSAAAAPKPTPAPTTPPAAKKGGGGKGLLIGAGVVAVGGGVALAAGGGGGGSESTPTPSDNRRNELFGPISIAEERYEQNFSIIVRANGVLVATATWTSAGGSRDGVLAMNLFDSANDAIATSNLRDAGSSVLTANVEPLSATVSEEYRLQVFHRDSCGGCVVTFTLTVKHP